MVVIGSRVVLEKFSVLLAISSLCFTRKTSFREKSLRLVFVRSQTVSRIQTVFHAHRNRIRITCHA